MIWHDVEKELPPFGKQVRVRWIGCAKEGEATLDADGRWHYADPKTYPQTIRWEAADAPCAWGELSGIGKVKEWPE